jgi:IS30 family transposase
MAEEQVSQRRKHARVSRNDLPHPVHSGLRSAEEEQIQHLQFKRRIRRLRDARDSGHRSGQIADPVSIRERPAEVEDRAIPCRWEGDLIGDTKNSHIATLVERQSRFTTLVERVQQENGYHGLHPE